MGMLDISTSLLKSLPEKPVLMKQRMISDNDDDSERVGLEVLSRLSTSGRNGSMMQGLQKFGGRGFDDGGEDESGLASPSTSVSSGSGVDDDDDMACSYGHLAPAGVFSDGRGGGRY